MTYERFEQLPVWQASIEMASAVYGMTDKPPFKGHYSLRDQIERAAISVSNNIAEGFERGTKQELITFLYIARGSAGEVRSISYILQKIPAFGDLAAEIVDIRSSTESISKQIGAWLRTLRESEMKGQRYVNGSVRRTDKAMRDREEFLRELEQIRAAAATKG